MLFNFMIPNISPTRKQRAMFTKGKKEKVLSKTGKKTTFQPMAQTKQQMETDEKETTFIYKQLIYLLFVNINHYS